MSRKISVVIPTYNRHELVVEAIKAAAAQTLVPDEIVVSDDCSTDRTAEAIEELALTLPMVRLIRQPRNLKGVDNWNAVIEGSVGDIIAFCTDDDVFLPHHLEKSVQHLDACPETGMVHAWFRSLVIEPDGETRILDVSSGNRPHRLRGQSDLDI